MKTAWGSIVAALAAPLLALLLLLWRMNPPPGRPGDAPPDVFSAGRALTLLQAILREEVPHPVGSAANRIVRDRIAARFRELGYQVEEHRSFACSPAPTCATVENIIARRPEDDRTRPAVLLAAHYDSVPAGPAATDDGVGSAAVLEIARAVRDQRFRNPVVFMVDDGEEAGLLGAEAFVADPEQSANVGVIVNLENRGSSGPSLLFETSTKNRWLMETAAQALDRPFSTSLFYTIYAMLPNDTDLTVFKRQGLAGLNFAAIETVAHYHTPLDNLANVNPRTLQHHGDNALAMVRALADRDLTRRSTDDASFFDLAGFTLLTWPVGLNVWLAVAVLAVLLVSAARRVRGQRTDVRSIVVGILSFLAAIVIAAIVGYAISFLARFRTGPITWVAHPLPSVTAAWLAGIAGASAAAAMFRRWSSGLLIGHAIGWSLLGLALSIVLPGTSYVFVMPAALAAAFSIFDNDRAIAAAWSALASLLILPFGILLYEALGSPSLMIIAVILSVVATTFTPILIAPGRLAIVALIGAVIAAAIAVTQPAYTPQRPKRMNLAYIASPTAAPAEAGAPLSSLWVATSMSEPLRAAAPFTEQEGLIAATWTRAIPRFAAPAPRLPLQPPDIQILRDEKGPERRIVARISSRRGADRIALFVQGGNLVEFARVNEVGPPAPSRLFDRPPTSWRRAAIVGTEATVEVIVRTGQPVEMIVADYSYGLPPQGAALADARRRSIAHPSDEGDLTIANRRLQLK